MAKRQDHALVIAQDVDGDHHSTTIRLRDKEERSSTSASGRWTHTDENITFTSASTEHLHWEWDGGTIYVGVKMGRASHKAGEEEHFQILITLSRARRHSSGKFYTVSAENDESGKLTHNARPSEAGGITWGVVRYERA